MIDRFINKVIEGDCLEVMKDIPEQSIDMILCDLPFGITQNKWDTVIDFQRLWQHYERIIKPNGVIVLNSQGIFTARLILSNEKLFKYKLSWIKSKSTNFLNAKKQPLRKHEDICVFYKNQPVYHPQMRQGEPYSRGLRKPKLTGSYGDFKPSFVESRDGKRYPNDVVYFKTAEHDGRIVHPTQKPVSLGRYLIRTYTNPGAIILDNACGSGTYLVAAALEDRRFIGIEKNRGTALFKKEPIDYVAHSKERINQLVNIQSNPITEGRIIPY